MWEQLPAPLYDVVKVYKYRLPRLIAKRIPIAHAQAIVDFNKRWPGLLVKVRSGTLPYCLEGMDKVDSHGYITDIARIKRMSS